MRTPPPGALERAEELEEKLIKWCEAGKTYIRMAETILCSIGNREQINAFMERLEEWEKEYFPEEAK